MKVWKTLKKLWKHLPFTLLGHTNFHLCFYNLIEIWYVFYWYFLTEVESNLCSEQCYPSIARSSLQQSEISLELQYQYRTFVSLTSQRTFLQGNYYEHKKEIMTVYSGIPDINHTKNIVKHDTFNACAIICRPPFWTNKWHVLAASSVSRITKYKWIVAL